ncbi:hypothetical protein vBAspALolek_53 [Aeromonas phage vB_AspA_Lolek]|nr:hypothetical protein vBAspALolek_53 [Aeromonas phage vB_AspA_Lolek]
MALIATVGGVFPANTYSGKAWEAQRLLPPMVLGQRATSILKTGSLPVLLKARVFAYTGDGLTVNIYRDPVYTGGAPDPVYNMSSLSTLVLESQLLVGFTLTDDGVPAAATMSLIGPASAQGAGSVLSRFGSNRILAPNTSYLLTFTSLSNAQAVTARLEFFEGIMDYSTLD